MRRSKQEILELFLACRSKLGRTPGVRAFCTETGVKYSEVSYWWPRPNALAEEAGAPLNELRVRLGDDEVFADYARVCLYCKRVPSPNELRVAQRELKTRTHTVGHRHGSIRAFRQKFRAWLPTAREEFKVILAYAGWSDTGEEPRLERAAKRAPPELHLHPFLPGCLQYLEVLARGESPPYEQPNVPASTLFERRTADAFRCLGFEMQQLGQGTGRNADCIARARRERVALIIDAKVRTNGYVLGTEDRKFLDYAVKHSKELQQDGFEGIYLVVIAPSFRGSDLKKLGEYVSQTPIRSVDMITARALTRMVEDSIRERSSFSLSDTIKALFGNKIISE